MDNRAHPGIFNGHQLMCKNILSAPASYVKMKKSIIFSTIIQLQLCQRILNSFTRKISMLLIPKYKSREMDREMKEETQSVSCK